MPDINKYIGVSREEENRREEERLAEESRRRQEEAEQAEREAAEKQQKLEEARREHMVRFGLVFEEHMNQVNAVYHMEDPEELKKKSKQLLDSLGDGGKAMQSLRDQLQSRNEQINTLKQRNEEHQQTIVELTANVNGFQEQLDEKQRLLDARQSDNQALSKKLKTAKEEIERLEEERKRDADAGNDSLAAISSQTADTGAERTTPSRNGDSSDENRQADSQPDEGPSILEGLKQLVSGAREKRENGKSHVTPLPSNWTEQNAGANST